MTINSIRDYNTPQSIWFYKIFENNIFILENRENINPMNINFYNKNVLDTNRHRVQFAPYNRT